jgi:hypothetical protein
MDFMETIKRPWQHPVEYLTLALWIILLLLVIGILTDGLRVATLWVKETATDVVT